MKLVVGNVVVARSVIHWESVTFQRTTSDVVWQLAYYWWHHTFRFHPLSLFCHLHLCIRCFNVLLFTADLLHPSFLN